MFPRHHVCPKRHRLFVLLLWHIHGFSFLFSVMMVLVEGEAVWGTGMGLFILIFLWKWESGSSVALPPSVALSPHWPSVFCLPSGIPGWDSLRISFLSFPFSPVMANMASTHVTREARFPPIGTVMEGNLGEAPSRRFPGISPDWWKKAGECVVIFGG